MNLTALKDLLAAAPIVPVLTVPEADQAVPLAEALAEGGLTVLEITLRTPAALEAIAKMKAAMPQLAIGAGTVLSPADAKAAKNAGADFFVSPGLTSDLVMGVKETGVPLIPGVATPSEAMRAYEAGFAMLKLFPAEAAGGAAMLKAMSGPLPHLTFMPTGGVSPGNMETYLSLSNVVAVGGTWLARTGDIANKDWPGITAKVRLALERANLRGPAA